MTNARIIRLGPTSNIVSVTKFDDDFGNMSYASGRKAKRQAKKMQRIADRKERKMARQDLRGSVKAARQQRRTDTATARQGRKIMRKGARVQRRAMGEPAEEAMEPALDPGYDQGLPPQEQGYEQPQLEQGGEYQEQGNYPAEEGGYEETETDENTSFEEESTGDEYDPNEEDAENDMYNFEGVIDKSEDPAGEMLDENFIEVPAGLGKLADDFEWNKEYVVRLTNKMDDITIKDPDANVDEYAANIEIKKDRVNILKKFLEAFTNFEGDFDADGQFVYYGELPEEVSGADGNPKPAKVAQRRAQTKRALANSRKKRAKITVVKTTLNPIIRTNRIVVPAEERAGVMGKEGDEKNPVFGQGTGLIGLTDVRDYDAPDPLDIQLGFDGKNIKWGNVAIGVGVALAAIYLIKKYNVIGKLTK